MSTDTKALQSASPVGSASGLQALMAKFAPEIEATMGMALAEPLMKAVINSARKNPKLLQATQLSLLSAVMCCAETGLMPDTPHQHCHIIPFFNGRKQQMEAVWMAGYRGYIELARESGQIATIEAEAVYSNDEFQWTLGTKRELVHVPADGDRGEVTHYYSIAFYLDVRIPPQFEILTAAEVAKIKAGAKDDKIWNAHPIEMGRKSAIRKLSKRLPLSRKWSFMVERDNEATMGDSQPVAVQIAEVVPNAEQTKTEALAEMLKENQDASVEEILELLREHKDVLPEQAVKSYTEAYLKTCSQMTLNTIRREIGAYAINPTSVSKAEQDKREGGEKGQEKEKPGELPL